MTKSPSKKRELKANSEPKIGDIKIYKGIRMVYGPDPWAWNCSFNCWFNLDQYIKEEGKPPPYVSKRNFR